MGEKVRKLYRRVCCFRWGVQAEGLAGLRDMWDQRGMAPHEFAVEWRIAFRDSVQRGQKKQLGSTSLLTFLSAWFLGPAL